MIKSMETRMKMSASQSRRWRLRRQVYLQNLLELHVGKKRSDKTRRKMSVAHRRQWAVRRLEIKLSNP